LLQNFEPGWGAMTIVDGDVVDITDINRQLPALHSTIGLLKSQLLEQIDGYYPVKIHAQEFPFHGFANSY
jgi:tRNA A37 threonylcarbamoyladenosine dehydratase